MEHLFLCSLQMMPLKNPRRILLPVITGDEPQTVK
jgi:hypothetical protein